MGDFSNLVTVRCPNHHEALVSGLWNFLGNRHGVDLDLKWAGQSTRAHRLIVEVFLSPEKLLSSTTLEAPTSGSDCPPPNVAPKDESRSPEERSLRSESVDSYASLNSLLEFLYNGKVTLEEERLDGLLKVAKELDFQMLVDAVETSKKSEVRRSSRRQRKCEPVQFRQDGEMSDRNSSSDGERVSRVKRVTRSTRATAKKRKEKPETEEESSAEEEEEEDDDESEQSSLRESSGDSDAAESDADNADEDEGDGEDQAEANEEEEEIELPPKSKRGRSSSIPRGKTRRYSPRSKAGTSETEKIDRRKVWRMKQPTLKCDHCPYKSRDSTCYRVHLAKHDPSIVIYRCSHCSKAFLTDDSLLRHKCRKVGTPKVYVCPHCDWRTQNVTVYQVHLAKHDPSIAIFNCATCGQAFLTRESLERHEQNHPVPPKVYLCQHEHCQYKSRSRVNLQVHQAKHDSSIKVLKCSTCSRAFITPESLEKHKISHSLPPRVHQCPHCDFATSVNRTFYRHLVTVHKVNAKGEPVEEKHKCRLCEFVCRQKHQLRNHLADKHAMEKPYKCDQCSYASVRRVDLTLHVKFVHKKVRPFMCHQCGHGSVSQNRLNRHLRCHSGEKPFACSMCDRRYADRHHYQEHIRRHTSDEKPFVCHVCGYSCNRRDNLKVHLRKMHSTHMEPDINLVRQQQQQQQPPPIVGGECDDQML